MQKSRYGQVSKIFPDPCHGGRKRESLNNCPNRKAATYAVVTSISKRIKRLQRERPSEQHFGPWFLILDLFYSAVERTIEGEEVQILDCGWRSPIDKLFGTFGPSGAS